jgi:hypothetical protein
MPPVRPYHVCIRALFKRTRIPEVVPEVLSPKHAEPSGSAGERSLPGRLLADVATTARAQRVAGREDVPAHDDTSTLQPYPEVAEVAPSEIAARTDPEEESELAPEPEVERAVAPHAVREDVLEGEDASVAEPYSEMAFAPTEIAAQTDPDEEVERAAEPEIEVAVAPHGAVREDMRGGEDACAAEPSPKVAQFAPIDIGTQADPEEELERGPEPEVAEAEASQAPVREEVRADDDPSALEPSAEVAPSKIAAPTAPHEEHERHAPEPMQVTAEASPPGTASQTGSAVERMESSQAEEPSTPKDLTCKISVWRGYRKAAFYAGTYHDGEEVGIAESKMFRAGGNGIPDRNTQSEKAYKALCEQLERDGWKRVSRGDTWFGDTFRRELTASEGPAPD